MSTMPIGKEFVFNHPRSIYAVILNRWCEPSGEFYVVRTTRDTPTCEKDVILTPEKDEIDSTAILIEV